MKCENNENNLYRPKRHKFPFINECHWLTGNADSNEFLFYCTETRAKPMRFFPDTCTFSKCLQRRTRVHIFFCFIVKRQRKATFSHSFFSRSTVPFSAVRACNTYIIRMIRAGKSLREGRFFAPHVVKVVLKVKTRVYSLTSIIERCTRSIVSRLRFT